MRITPPPLRPSAPPPLCRAICITLFLLVLPQFAHAHLVSTGAGPFYDGTAHFFLTFEEVLPVLALSLFAGLRGPQFGRWVMAILPAAWIVGAYLSMLFSPIKPPVLLSAAFLILPGLLLATDLKLPSVAVFAVTAIAGLVMGFFNAVAMKEAGSGMLAVFGSAASAFLISVFSAALAVRLSKGWTRIAIRVAGSWLTAIGLLALGWSLRK